MSGQQGPRRPTSRPSARRGPGRPAARPGEGTRGRAGDTARRQTGADPAARAGDPARRQAAAARALSAVGRAVGSQPRSVSATVAGGALATGERRAAFTTRRLLAFLGVVALFLVLVVPTLRSYLRQQGEIDALRTQIAQQEKSVAALEREKRLWQDPAYVEQQIRQRLKFAKPGERSYTVLDADPAQGESGTIAEVPVVGDRSWYGQLWESTRIADRSETP